MADETPGRGSDQFALRFPNGMRGRIKDAAKDNGRSMNAEIVARLEQSFHKETELRHIVMQAEPGHFEAKAGEIKISMDRHELISALKEALAQTQD